MPKHNRKHSQTGTGSHKLPQMTTKGDGHDAGTTNTKRQHHYTQWHKLTQMQTAKEYKEKHIIATSAATSAKAESSCRSQHEWECTTLFWQRFFPTIIAVERLVEGLCLLCITGV
jgi:hypothetical protein